jgi:hypothetical protein
LQACIKHRTGFRKLVSLTEQLIEVRQNAEDVLIGLGELKVPEDPFESGYTPEKGQDAFDKWVGG